MAPLDIVASGAVRELPAPYGFHDMELGVQLRPRYRGVETLLPVASGAHLLATVSISRSRASALA